MPHAHHAPPPWNQASRDRLDISGTFNLKADPQSAWDLLNDVAVLQACIPGCRSLNATGPDSYEAELSVGVGPVRGAYRGTVILKDRKPPRSYRMIVEGSGGAGFIKGEGAITLSPGTGGTTVTVSGTAEAGGLIARVGQRLIAGAANQMLKQFFACLSKRARVN